MNYLVFSVFLDCIDLENILQSQFLFVTLSLRTHLAEDFLTLRRPMQKCKATNAFSLNYFKKVKTLLCKTNWFYFSDINRTFEDSNYETELLSQKTLISKLFRKSVNDYFLDRISTI